MHALSFRLQTTMMETLSTSIIPKEEREAEFAHVLSAIVDPLVTLCEMAQGLDALSKSIFTVNCLYTMQVCSDWGQVW